MAGGYPCSRAADANISDQCRNRTCIAVPAEWNPIQIRIWPELWKNSGDGCADGSIVVCYQNRITADAGHKRQAHPPPSIGHHPFWRINMIQSNRRSFKNKPLSNIQQAQFSIGWRFCPVCGHKLYQKTESCSGSISIKCLKCGNVATVDLAYRRRWLF